jgi:hypothetical protein
LDESWDVKHISTIGLGGDCVVGGGLVGGLERVDTDSAIKKSRRKEVRIARTPFDLEGPVVARRELSKM